jgi:hypothetical protein
MDDIAQDAGVDEVKRAGRGAFAVVAYARAVEHDLTSDLTEEDLDGEAPETHIEDLLADLMHLASHLDLDFEELLDSAITHYEAECIDPYPCGRCGKVTRKYVGEPWHWPGKAEVVMCYSCGGYIDCPGVPELGLEPHVADVAEYWKDHPTSCRQCDDDKERGYRVYDHDARPDDLPEPGDRCKDCGEGVTWMGRGSGDWVHVHSRENQ